MVDSNLKNKVLDYQHNNPHAEHTGYLKTYQRAKWDFFWRGMKRGIKKKVRECNICQVNKNETIPTPELMRPFPIPSQAWIDISLDFIEGLSLFYGMSVILVVVDRYTKYGHFMALAHPYVAQGVWLMPSWTGSSSYMNFLGPLCRIRILYFWALLGGIYLHYRATHWILVLLNIPNRIDKQRF